LDLQQEVTDSSFQVNNDPAHTCMRRHANTSWMSDFLCTRNLFSPNPALFSEIKHLTSRSTVDSVKQNSLFIYYYLNNMFWPMGPTSGWQEWQIEYTVTMYSVFHSCQLELFIQSSILANLMMAQWTKTCC